MKPSRLEIPQRPPPPDHRPLGMELRRRRESAGLSLREVARRMELSAPYVSDLEQGKRNWTAKTRDAFLKAIKL